MDSFNVYTLTLLLLIISQIREKSATEDPQNGSMASGWRLEDYPNPVLDPIRCGYQAKTSFLCDPDGVLSPEEGRHLNQPSPYIFCFQSNKLQQIFQVHIHLGPTLLDLLISQDPWLLDWKISAKIYTVTSFDPLLISSLPDFPNRNTRAKKISVMGAQV